MNAHWGGKLMIFLKNFAGGVIIATICLAPAAWADAGRLLNGQPIAPALAAAAEGASSSPMAQAASGLIPRLVVRAVGHLAALSPEQR
jgi:putative intracellular protease/amidase